jgi:hypothetical protein
MDTAARPRRCGESTSGWVMALTVVLLGGWGCSDDEESTTARITSGSITVDVTVTRKGDQLCVRGDQVAPEREGRPTGVGSWCGSSPDQARPVGHGGSTSGAPDSALYVLGVSLKDVEGFSVRAGDQTFAVTPTALPDGAFGGMKAWFLLVEKPPGRGTPTEIQDIRRP